MIERAEEIRLAASTLLGRVRPQAVLDPSAAPGAEALAGANVLLEEARAALPTSPLLAAMRPLGPGATLADLATRLAALQRAITFL